MFRNTISRTPLTEDFANEFFRGKVWGDSFNSDMSLLATLRAIVYPRMGETDEVIVTHTGIRYPNDGDEFDEVVPKGDDPNELVIVNINSSDDQNRQKIFDALQGYFARPKMNGWIRIDKVNTLFSKVFRVECYVNESLRQSIVFADYLDIRKFHYLQIGVLGFLPWFFDPSKGVPDEEMNLLYSLREKTSSKYEACIAELAKRYSFEEMKLRKMLGGFELRYDRMALVQANRDVESYLSQINDLNDRIASCLRQKRDAETLVIGLQKKIADGGESNEMLDLFLSNSHLHLVSANDSSMTFIVTEDLTFFNEEDAQTLIDNKGSYLYEPDTDLTRIISKEDLERFAKAVFIDQRLKISTCAAYKFDLQGSVRAIEGYDYPSYCSDYIPNPHIHYFHCLGSYSQYITRLLSDHDYTGAVIQCVASAKSINLRETPTMIRFVKALLGVGTTARKCVRLPDGTSVTAKEAAEWLKKEEEQNAHEETEEQNG